VKQVSKLAIAAAGAFIGASGSWAETLPTHRIPAALAVEAASETIAACARQGYHETAVVLDADGTTIIALRGDGAGIHTLDSAHDKAYTSVSFKNDTLALRLSCLQRKPEVSIPAPRFFRPSITRWFADIYPSMTARLSPAGCRLVTPTRALSSTPSTCHAFR
jgi:heme-degrading protein